MRTLGRPRHDDAAHVKIDARGQYADVADDAGLARSEPIEDRLALFARRRSVHVLCGDSRFEEALCDMLGVATIDAEAEGGPPLATPKPRLDDVAGDGGLIHGRRKLAFMKIARDGANAGEVRLAGREHDEGGKIAVADQVGGRRRDDQVVVVLAEPTRPGRCGQSDEGNVRAVLHPPEDFPVELVRLVDDDEIHVRTLTTRDRLNGADLDGLIAIGSLVDSLHDADAGDALGFEGGDRLVDEADSAGTVKATRFPLSRARRMMCAASQGLASARRHLEHRSAATRGQRGAQGLERAFLMGPKRTKCTRRSDQGAHVRPPSAGSMLKVWIASRRPSRARRR